MGGPRTFDRLRPEWLAGDSPRFLENIGKNKHGHVAAHAVANLRNRYERVNHAFLQFRLTVVQLECVGPTGEVWVAPVRDDSIPIRHPNSLIVVWRRGQVFFRARHIILRMRHDPRVIFGSMVGNKIEHQPQVSLQQSLSEPPESLDSADRIVYLVACDRKAGAAYIRLLNVRHQLSKLRLPGFIASGDLTPGIPCPPDTQEPHPVESPLLQPVEELIGNVIEHTGRSRFVAELPQHRSCVDLKQAPVHSCRR